MNHRTAPVAPRLCAALLVFAVVFAAAPARADLLVDDYKHASTPDIGGSRVISPSGNPVVITPATPPDFPPEGFLTYDGPGESFVDYFFAATDISDYRLIRIDFVQIADVSDQPVDAEISLAIWQGTNAAAIDWTPLPFVDGSIYEDFGTVTSLYFHIHAFASIGTVDLTQVDGFTIGLSGESAAIVSIDIFSLAIPTPAALPAGLVGLALLATRRRAR